jgi:hypothetical protein
MIPVEKDVAIVKTEKNAAIKGEIRETLETMKAGDSFLVTGIIKKGTVKAIAVVMDIKIKIAMDANNNLRCWKMQ